MACAAGFTVKQSWGVGTVRLCAGFPGNLIVDEQNPTYCLPLGSQIVCWDIATRQRRLCFQAHSDLIICLLYNESCQTVLTVSYTGEIKLWDKQFQLLHSEKASFDNASYGSWSNSGSSFVICGSSENDSFISLYQVNKDENGKVSCSKQWNHVGQNCVNSDKGPSTSHSSQQLNDSVTYINQKDGYIIVQYSSHGNVLAVYERYHGNASQIHLLTKDGQLIHSTCLDPLGNYKSAIMCTTPCNSDGIFAVGFQGGLFIVLHDHDLTTTAIFQATGSPQVALWDREYILAVSYLSGLISWWSTNGELVHEIDGAPKDSIMHLDWVPNSSHHALWVAGIMSLSYVEFEYPHDSETSRFPCEVVEKHQLQYHEVTGCGFDLSKSHLAASGDFTGNVFIWEKGNNDPIYRLKHDGSIRSLSWNDDTLFVGSLDGMVLKWTASISTNSLTECIACTGAVLSIRWSTVNKTQLAIGLDNGSLLVYHFKDDQFADPIEALNIEAHHCALKDDKSMRSAEVWSICWSPCGGMIATASEDQTTGIWQAITGERLHSLHGHTTAVTSVDWKILHNDSNTNILATCADDRTVRIYNGSSFNIIHVVKLNLIMGWFTLTYLSLNPISQQCLCSTQNGHLAIWDCLTGELVTCRKMHCGSIEGLAWGEGFREFGTVSSDCVVNVFEVDSCHLSADCAGTASKI